MLRAVREGRKSETPAPPLPRPKPAKLPGGKGQPVKRRGFLAGLAGLVATPFALGWTSLVAASTASVLGLARFMFPNVLVEPPMTFKVGPPSAFPYGTVDTSFKAARGIWIVHTTFQGRNVIYALISVCTHLGCTPSWLNAEQKFKCPCHGSGFYMNGINFEGPAPRPLERAGISLAADGMLEVDKSIKFQEELGQWEDPKSFVEVA
jgi:cytochrome b6-f complex iron-sulfur subunit